ncbi:MAG: dihydroorotase [Candidatus Thorarchaeota archaeon]
MPVDIVLKDGMIIVDEKEVVRSIAISVDKIEGIYRSEEEPEGKEVIDCQGLYVLPGLIDIHVHLRDLNQSDKEDYESGTRAAAAGGVTTVVDMPNSDPPVLDRKALESKIASALGKRYVNVGFYAGIPKKVETFDTRMFPDILGLKVYPHAPLAKGARYTKKRIQKCFDLAAKGDLPLLLHPDISSPKEKPDDIEEFFLKHSCKVETEAVKRFLDSRVQYENRLHVCHVSCASTARIILEHRAEATLTAEVTPHHMFLSGENFPHEDGTAKVLPPLRSPYDGKKLQGSLCMMCAIDCVASDHAPHSAEDKKRTFLEAASGIPGLETTLPLMLTEVFEGRIAWADYFRICCSAPARILGIPNKGVLAKGYDADIVLVRKEEYKVVGKEFYSKAKITPFEGRRVLARPLTTIVGGEIVFRDGEIVIGPGIAGRVPVRRG